MSATDLPALLSEAGISLRSVKLEPGRTSKLICPKCSGGKTREVSLSVTIDNDGEGGRWLCQRGSCGWKGGGRVRREGVPRRSAAPREEIVRKPPPRHEAAQINNKPPPLYAFFEKRGISADTVDAFGIYIARHWFPDPIGEQPAIVFPYTLGGSVVNRKYRPPQKNPMMQEKDALPTLFNIDAVTSLDVVWVVEGEPDVLAMHEAGYKQTVTLPNGSSKKLLAEDDPAREDDKRFLPLGTHAELLGQVEKFVLAGDNDESGLVLREEFARRLGRHRCWIVTWPEGCKDCGDVLKLHGAAGVQAAVEAAEPYPIDGVQRIKPGMLAALRSLPPPPVLTTGTGASDLAFKLPGEGRLIVVTGLPNAGKSVFVRFVMVHTMERHDRRWLVFSPEMAPWGEFVASCAEVFIRRPFRGTATAAKMEDHELERAEKWLASRLIMLASDAEEDPPTLDWIVERARVAVLRDGVTDLLIDPWNEIEHQRKGESETDYTGRSLQRLRSFGLRHGVNVWIVVHPAKLLPIKPGGEIQPPGLYDIAGSAHWANKSDLALTVHTPLGRDTEVYLRKSRFARWGRRGSKATITYDASCGTYSTPAQGLYDDEGR